MCSIVAIGPRSISGSRGKRSLAARRSMGLGQDSLYKATTEISSINVHVASGHWKYLKTIWRTDLLSELFKLQLQGKNLLKLK